MATAELDLIVRGAAAPDQRVRLNVPIDVPLAEMLDDFVDAAEEHALQLGREFDAHSDWRLQLPDGSAPNGDCLAELTVSVLALYDAQRAEPPFTAQQAAAPAPPLSEPPEAPVPPAAETPAPPAAETPAPPQAATSSPTRRTPRQSPGAPRSRSGGRSSQRIVRARAEEALPRPMGTVARTLQALTALSPSYKAQEQEARDLGVNDPARFVREHHQSAAGRVREAWRVSDYKRLLEAMVLLPAPPSCQTIAVLSPKGGVGKTTITSLLSMQFNYVRQNQTVAVDANPDMSNLSAVLSPGRGVPVDELVQRMKVSIERGQPMRGMEVLGLLGIGPHGVRVAPSANDPKRALDRETFLWLYENLKAYAEVMVLDCGTGLFDDPAQAAVQTADQLVVVVDGEPDTMQMVASGECQTLLRAFDGPVFLVVNKLTPRVRRRVNLGEFEQELSFAQGIVEVTYDEKAAANLSKFRWDDGPPQDWAVQIRELAALLATGWPTV
ncbi:MAG: hypothetical protein FWD04_07365 [Conexibacteraceae bacterium]|nr:hypothetical protein [Conexibacteraceae bacterium]